MTGLATFQKQLLITYEDSDPELATQGTETDPVMFSSSLKVSGKGGVANPGAAIPTKY